MNIDNFLNLQPQQQVDCINKLLKEHSLDEAATLLKISKSKLSAMMKEGNFVLIKSLNQYCRYISPEAQVSIPPCSSIKSDEALTFIEDNLDSLKALISNTSNTLNLDSRIYAKDITMSSKSFKINDAIYADFTTFCKENYSYLKLQDLFSQALLEFIQNHQPH
ncbi:MAG: hypothetical protein ACLSH8_00365 [Zhenhengia sp.]|uniref:hypothetical protein n=1 Tax=Zhenhengia sp. TaxID=2944208 RepID=UPI0039916B6B